MNRLISLATKTFKQPNKEGGFTQGFYYRPNTPSWSQLFKIALKYFYSIEDVLSLFIANKKLYLVFF